MFSWYYPKEIEMHSFTNGMSLSTKLGNWSQLERVSSLGLLGNVKCNSSPF